MPQFAEQLAVETIHLPAPPPPSAFFSGKIEFPGRERVVVVIRPRAGQSFEDPEMFRAAERRCDFLVGNVGRILQSDLTARARRRPALHALQLLPRASDAS